MDMSTIVKGSAAEKAQDRVAFWAIFSIPLIWGIGFPLTHNAVAHADPGVYAFARSFVALLALLPFVLPVVFKVNRQTVVGGFLLGVFSALNIVSQSYALSYLSSASAAFCVTLSVVFIPLIMLALRQGVPSRMDILSVVIGILGAYVFLGAQLELLSVGYFWGLTAAFAIAMTICIVGKLTSQYGRVNRLALAFFQILFSTIILAYFPLNRSIEQLARTEVWIAVVFMGVMATALAVVLQTRFQQRVGSTRTSVIFNLDLVFAGLFGLLNREPLVVSQVIGGAVLLLASSLESALGVIKKFYCATFGVRCKK
ncbi:DMT family transporter [Pseudomonas citronellolis]|uniref:DMT family transporter n=1 Tax=Pseudomonas citronellolis TaxID=53408 RepID=UPI0023E3BB70|nr:DMT family transporter [Pseudomonas citronellolis]MDF3933461.1 DMT family transporter [Pseudomonas citronellolis]